MENAHAQKKRVKTVIRILNQTYPDVRLALDFTTPLELLMALILAAQCTDERVNRVTPSLFRKYRAAKDWAATDRAVLEEEIHTTGFFRQKAASIQKCTAELVARFHGEVPRDLDDLLPLPGVGRKTANILRGNAFGDPAIGVDTHVGRVSYRLGFTAQDNPDKVEADLVEIVPRTDQVKFCSLIQRLGREFCVARKPRCADCPVADYCPKVDVV